MTLRLTRWRRVLGAALLLSAALAASHRPRRRHRGSRPSRPACGCMSSTSAANAREAGQLVLIPGWTFDAEIWRHEIDRFAKDRRVIAIDPRSQGLSTMTGYGDTPEQRARDLKAVLGQVKPRPHRACRLVAGRTGRGGVSRRLWNRRSEGRGAGRFHRLVGRRQRNARSEGDRRAIGALRSLRQVAARLRADHDGLHRAQAAPERRGRRTGRTLPAHAAGYRRSDADRRLLRRRPHARAEEAGLSDPDRRLGLFARARRAESHGGRPAPRAL